uniref:Chitin-binding type-2 domain-containing protein n=1 Tax=Glossina austeni TaxID=7395 RepID=A0A1A9UUL0_GLOAU
MSYLMSYNPSFQALLQSSEFRLWEIEIVPRHPSTRILNVRTEDHSTPPPLLKSLGYYQMMNSCFCIISEDLLSNYRIIPIIDSRKLYKRHRKRLLIQFSQGKISIIAIIKVLIIDDDDPKLNEKTRSNLMETQKEEFQCPSNIANGNYADPVTCRRFYQCVDGFPYLNRCPSGLYFDDVQKFCTFKDEAKCGPLSTSKSI